MLEIAAAYASSGLTGEALAEGKRAAEVAEAVLASGAAVDAAAPGSEERARAVEEYKRNLAALDPVAHFTYVEAELARRHAEASSGEATNA